MRCHEDMGLWLDEVAWTDEVLWSDEVSWLDDVSWSDKVSWLDEMSWSDEVPWLDEVSWLHKVSSERIQRLQPLICRSRDEETSLDPDRHWQWCTLSEVRQRQHHPIPNQWLLIRSDQTIEHLTDQKQRIQQQSNSHHTDRLTDWPANWLDQWPDQMTN